MSYQTSNRTVSENSIYMTARQHLMKQLIADTVRFARENETLNETI
jgi:hypothetical protein